MKLHRFSAAVLGLVLLAGGAQAERALTVFAAASLQGALDEAVAGFEGEVVISYGGSATMARQVASGAPADLVILANNKWMDWLETEGAVQGATRQDFLKNTLVVVGAKGAEALAGPEEIAERLGADGRLAIGQSTSVPAGIYAREWLEGAGVWSTLTGHLAESENVRLALALVARGEAPLGVVYASDAQAEPQVAVVFKVPETGHSPIVYPMALAQEALPQAIDLELFLQTPEVADIFGRYGFGMAGN